jgi:hypothetical protein
LTAPNPLKNAGKAIADAMPAPLKNFAGKAGGEARDAFRGLTEQQLINEAIKVVTDGFGDLEKYLANKSINENYVIGRINGGKQEQKISDLSQVCLLRAYDIAAITAKEELQHRGIALVEGAATGAPGLPGIPFDLALSMLAYFRAVQSVAMFYGYNVKSDPAELLIASDVFMCAMSPNAQGNKEKEYVGKVLLFAEASMVRQTVKKGWEAMASKGGTCLAIAQVRALANKAAQKALEAAGKKGLEAGALKNVLELVGKNLSQKAVGKAVPVVGAVIGALFDTAQIGRVLEIAELFYRQRFILEKEERVGNLLNKTANPAEPARQ